MQYTTVQCGTILAELRSTMQYSAIQYTTMEYNAVHCCTILAEFRNLMQYSAMQCSTAGRLSTGMAGYDRDFGEKCRKIGSNATSNQFNSYTAM